MFRIWFGLFIVLHGLVHLLYVGQSRRLFALQPGMVWPDGSWAFSRLLGAEPTRLLASISLVLVAVGFVAGGLGLIWRQDWWPAVVVAASSVSAVLTILLWDGRRQDLDDQGGVGLLINLALITAVVLIPRLPFAL